MDRSRTNKLGLVVLAVLCFGLPGVAQAFDHLEITVVGPVIVDGHPSATVGLGFDVQVRAVNADGSTDTAADYVHAYLDSPDVAATLPAPAYLSNGERVFSNVVLLGAGQPVRLRVGDLDDGSVPFAEVLINCWNPVDHFVIDVPAGDKYVGTPISVTITAKDALNNRVRNFADDVVLSPAIGDFTAGPTITLQETDFALGIATTVLTFQGTDAALHQNTLQAVNTVTYPGQAGAPSGSLLISPLYPGPLARVVLLLPGETLTPGVSPGKSGTPTSQISGFAFNGVDVYATDQYWNPVMAGPYPTLSWSSDDGDAGVILPAGGPMSSNEELDQSMTLVTSGLTQVTVTASGAVSASSSSQVNVNPAGLDRFEFDYAVFDTTAIQATTSPFTVRVRAKDAFGNAFPYNGPVSLRARIGGVDESADYLIATTNTFVDGQLDALIQVTKRAFSVQLVVDSNTGVVAVSGDFQVNAGPLDRILLTYPGETWTPGLNDPNFSGNMGVPNQTTAGGVLDPVEVRAVDLYGNLVAGSRIVTLTCPTGYFFLLDSGNNVIEDHRFTLNGPAVYKIVFRTAGQQHIQANVGGIEPSVSSTVSVSPNTFIRLAVVAPGETLDPGTFDPDGKQGAPHAQDAGVPFDVQVYATDYYYNPISNSSPTLPLNVDFSSSDAAAVLPGNPQTLFSNAGSFPVTLKTLATPNQQTISVMQSGGTITGQSVVPIVAGTIDHFDIGINNYTNPDVGDVLQDIPDHQAGTWIPNLTVIARDAFGNHISSYQDSVTLSLSVGGNVITPTRISMTDGFGAGLVWGVWRNQLRVTRAGTGLRVIATDDIYGRTGQSNVFDVFPGPYESIQMLLPGETATPGEFPGKYGVALPQTAGDTLTVTVAALDSWWNPVPDQPLVHIESSDYIDLFSPNDVALDPDGTTDFQFAFRTATTHTLRVWDLVEPAQSDSSDVAVSPGEFFRLMAVAPGETVEPGGPEVDGKTGQPDAQIATLQFPLVVYGVDRFWNRVDVSSDRVRLLSDDGSIVPGNPINNGQTLSHGEIVFPVALNGPGLVTMTALDETDPTKLGQEVIVEVQQGAQYRITLPDTAVAGPPSTFPVTVELVDASGVVMTNAFNPITVRALTPTLQPAAGNLLVTSAQLDSGTVDIPMQAYDRVEQIVLEISDPSGRLGYSSILQLISGGLGYEIVVGTDPAPVAGPPAVFPVTVRLRDLSTGNVVNDDRFFDLEMLDSAGNPALGVLASTEQRLIDGEVTFNQSYTRAEDVILRVFDDTGLEGHSSVFHVGPAAYARVQVLAPGETPLPGVPASAATGKTGAPVQQRAGEPFPLSVRAVDAYWNLVDTVNGGQVHLASSDDSFGWPDNPSQNDVPFVDGVRDVTAFVAATGAVTVTASDGLNPGAPSQSVEIPTTEPYAFEIITPATAQTGGVPGFSMTVRLVDPDTGDLVTDAFHRIMLTPYRSDYAPASGVLGLTEAWLVGGVAVINDQTYSALQDIVIHVRDDFGRQAYSDPIEMETAGLYYRVTAPDEAVVGGPATFPLEIELVDANTDQRVDSQSPLVQIQVYAAGTGLAGGGVVGVIQQLVTQGHAVVNQTYTLAEEIYFQVTDGDGNSGVSNSCRMLPDGFKQLQIVAPGETPDPGADNATGKTGAPLVQIAGEPFNLEIRAVDQFWNPVTSINDGAIELACSETGAFSWLNPGDYHAPFVNGRRTVGVILDVEGNLSLVAQDPQHTSAGEGQVTIPVVEAAYAITVPDTAYVGPPATFPVQVELINPSTGDPVPSGNSFTLEALKPDLSPASGDLAIGNWTLLLGQAEITTQSYAYSEQIVIRVSDERGRASLSPVMAVIPMGVTYAIDVPDTVVAGEPWAMTVSRVDVVTGRTVTGYDETFDLLAMNAASGDPRPLAGAMPAGTLTFTYGVTTDGVAAIPNQTYDRAELIRLRVVDENGGNVLSPPILVKAAAASEFVLALEEADGSPVDRVLRPRDRVWARVTARDASGNAAPGAAAVFTVTEGDASLGVARTTEHAVATDGSGTALVEVRVDDYARNDLLLQARVDALEMQQAALPVAGPPTTDPDLSGVAEEFQDGWYVSFDTEIALDAASEVVGMGVTVYFDVDGVDGPAPLTEYVEPFTLAGLGVEGGGLHELRFYAVEDGGVAEPLRFLNLYTTQAVTLEQEITNRPNPFAAGREETRILFNPPASGTVTITIYDLYGAVVHVDRMDALMGQTAEYVWDGRNGKDRVVANGGYICRITGQGFDYRRKIAVVK